MRLQSDDRGQSIGMARFFLSVFVVGSLCFFILSELGAPMLTGAKNATSNATAIQGSNWMLGFLNMVPVIMLLIAFIGIIILAIFQREVGR